MAEDAEQGDTLPLSGTEATLKLNEPLRVIGKMRESREPLTPDNVDTFIRAAIPISTQFANLNG